MSYPGYPPAYGAPGGYGYAPVPPAGYAQGGYPPPAGYPPPGAYQGAYPPQGYPPGYQPPGYPPPVPGYGTAPYGGVPAYGSGYGYAGSPPPAASADSRAPSHPASASTKPARGRSRSPAPAAEPKRPSRPEQLIVTGCKHATVGDIVRGTFNLVSDNHDKPVYRKTEKANDLDVMLYFWDDRDGPSFCGWWFGPKVGGDQVWAYHPDKAAPTPPPSGWKVPYDGDVDDTFAVTPPKTGSQSSSKSGSRGGESSKDSSKAEADKRKEERKEEDRRRQSENDKKRHEEKQKKKEDEEKRKAEEAKRKQEEETKRKAEEEERKKREEEQKKMDEETRKQEEIKRKREAEENRRNAQKSMLAIRRVIQKVRAATLENFEQLQAELQEELRKELDNTGNQAQKIKEESEKGLEQARKRIDQLLEQRRKEEDKKAAEEALKRAAVDKAKALVQQLCDLVAAAENQANRMKEIAQPLDADSCSRLIVAEVEATSQAVEDAALESKRMTKDCTDFILTRGPEMKDPNPTPQGQISEQKQMLAAILQRINDATRSAESTLLSARGAKDKAVKKAAAVEKTRQIETTFEKYDRDADDALSRKEVQNYAKGEFGLLLSAETLDMVWKNMVEDDARGVKLDSFPWLMTMVGVAREVARDKRRLADKREKEQVITGMKDDLRDKVKEAAKAVDEADKDVSKAEKAVQPLAAKARVMPAEQMISISTEVARLVEEAKETIGQARQEIDSLAEGLDENSLTKEDMREFLKQEAKQLELHMGRLDARVFRTVNLSTRFMEQAQKKKEKEFDRLRRQAAKVLRYQRKLKKLSNDAFFDLLDTDGDGEIDVVEFCHFFESADMDVKVLEMELTPAEIARAREMQGEDDLAKKAEDEAVKAEKKEEGEDAVKEEIKEEMPLDKKVASKQPVGEKVVLSQDELSRLFTYLVEEGGRNLSREAFFRLVRLYMKVVKETVMTTGMSIGSSRTLRRLDIDEVVEVLEGPLKDPAIGIMRIHGKCLTDGTEGWVSVGGNQGTHYLVEGGNFYKVVKESMLTDAFELDGDKANRKLKEGTILEVREWPKKEPTSGDVRMKGKVRNDGAIGWVTTTGSTGAVFLELV